MAANIDENPHATMIQTFFCTHVRNSKLINALSAKQQTAKWRTAQTWYDTGKSNECELYQPKKLSKILDKRAISTKTNMRMNILTSEIKMVKNPLKQLDGFDWTEDFDGIAKKDGKTIYINLKFVCGAGGAQTRSLLEVYHFIVCQINNIKKFNDNNAYFANILDGDESNKHSRKYINLINTLLPGDNHIFCGCMLEFQKYWKLINL